MSGLEHRAARLGDDCRSNASPRSRTIPAVVWLALLALSMIVMAGSGDSGPASDTSPRPSSQPADTQIDDDFVRKLLGGESTDLGAIEATLEKMDESARLLKLRLDAGEKTQALQEDVLSGIDRMIAQARKQGGKSKGGSRRRRTSRPQRNRKPPEDTQPKGAGQPDALAGGSSGGAPGEGGDKTGGRRSAAGEATRGWGFLPERDRDEIIQGFEETFMSKYREHIERYYRLLAREEGE
ncbi:MAG: hypothetical protein O7D94_09475 [Planctomycetota bacterium]|nr:hypothetical protein [Planctomycetota bacterium]